MKKNERDHKAIKSTAITQYVENYYLTRGINPFKVRDRVVVEEKKPGEKK